MNLYCWVFSSVSFSRAHFSLIHAFSLEFSFRQSWEGIQSGALLFNFPAHPSLIDGLRGARLLLVRFLEKGESCARTLFSFLLILRMLLICGAASRTVEGTGVFAQEAGRGSSEGGSAPGSLDRNPKEPESDPEWSGILEEIFLLQPFKNPGCDSL